MAQSTDRILKIIGGLWRSRRLNFPDQVAIRPTPTRVRETLFNWLQLTIPQAKCLELYAGSGILSIEALSRGAKHVTILDSNKHTVDAIKNNLQLLSVERNRFDCLQAQANTWLAKQKEPFDVIFLDPPFDSHEIDSILSIIENNGLLTELGFVYLETPALIKDLPENWLIHRQKKAGAVHYCLLNKQLGGAEKSF